MVAPTVFQPDPQLYPFRSHHFTHNGQRIHYVDEGTGPPMVFVHGNPTWSFYFRRLISQFRAGYRCLALDHVGCGLSSRPTLAEYDYSLQSRVTDLEAWIDSLALTEPITLVVQDWGGMIGLAYGVRHPERIGRIIASNTGCGHLPATKGFPYSLWLGRNTRLGAWLILQRNLFCRCAARWCVTRQPLSDAVKSHYLGPYDTPEHRLAVLKFVQTIPLKPSDPGYALVSEVVAGLATLQHIPTLLLWGMRDFVFDRHFLAQWQSHFPQAHTVTWPDAGHYLFEDAPDEALREITAFLGSTHIAGI